MKNIAAFQLLLSVCVAFATVADIELYTAPNTQSTLWDFETGWQDWTHTNGMSWSVAWDVQPSNHHPAYTPPSAGDSCMWIDDDMMGQPVWTQDSALSPICIPDASMDWLKYGFGIRNDLDFRPNELHVGIKHFTGGVWTATELAFYPSLIDTGPAWDSVDVSAYATADSVQVYFYYDDLGTWAFWAVFDNVSIDATPVTGISGRPGVELPLIFGFAPSMATVSYGHVPIGYTTTASGHVSLRVYDKMGRLIRTLVNALQPAGEKSVYWDNKDVNQRVVSNGVYFLKLEVEGKTAVKKLILVR